MEKISIKRIISHILFWLMILCIYTYVYGRSLESFNSTFMHTLATLPVYMGATYYTLYVLIPKYFFSKKYSSAIIPIIYMLLFSAFFEILITILFTLQTSGPASVSSAGINKFSLDIYFRLIGIYVVVFSAAAVKLMKHWYSAQQKNSDLMKQKLEAELNLLKAQVHPHFLFNTLNNLYSLALGNSAKTAELILKLSEMLDYILYGCKENYVTLKKEILLIDNYIELEQIRYGDRLKIVKNYRVLFPDVKIAPLLLLPFVENSFKHGASSRIDNSWINININSDNSKVLFTVSNSKKNKENNNEQNNRKGIGLENLKSRLELIYKGDYILDIKETPDEFSVSLEINLKQKTAVF